MIGEGQTLAWLSINCPFIRTYLGFTYFSRKQHPATTMAALLLDERKVSKSAGACILYIVIKDLLKDKILLIFPYKSGGEGVDCFSWTPPAPVTLVPTALFLDERKTGPSTPRLFLKRTQNWEIDEDTWPFIFAVRPKLYIPSTPNNSNETHTFMCLGRIGRFGQH